MNKKLRPGMMLQSKTSKLYYLVTSVTEDCFTVLDENGTVGNEIQMFLKYYHFVTDEDFGKSELIHPSDSSNLDSVF